MNSKEFFNEIKAKLFNNKLSQSQVDGINSVLVACKSISDKRWIAYILATAYHETAKTMQPIAEYGKGKGNDYGKKLKMSRQSYTTPDKLYYGRGYVQLTWFENYLNMGKLLGADLLNNPDLALNPTIAAKIMIEGMTKGLFTGKSLKNYFNDDVTDFRNARRIINGLDRAELIASNANIFFNALTT